jgi:membrane associated rhomboid family serine protease
MIPIRDKTPSRTFPFVNIGLIIINIVVFIYEISLGQEMDKFVGDFGIIPAKSIWLINNAPLNLPALIFPFFSSMFIHGGWLHIIGNMWYLWIFGDNVEDRMGHARYLIFYLLCGIAAGITHIFFNQTSSLPTVGASGAIAGVMGAYLMLYPFGKVLTLVPIFFFITFIDVPALFFLGFWIILQFVQGTISSTVAPGTGGVAWWAHLGGFVVGAILIFVFKKRGYQSYI